MDEIYNPKQIEENIRLHWEANLTFSAKEDNKKEKFYCLTMFPYPSGRLHMGHVRVYTIGDVISRYQRMLGKNVLQPMGWDAFGLPAENAAIQHKIPPAEWTIKNVTQMREQMKKLGMGYDWSREIKTCDPSYYKWEQWFFLQLYKKGLVYKKNAEVNWDPVDQTILANEQVVDGRGWRSGALVERREIPQWFLKITAYAEELLNDLDQLEGWPTQVKTMQKNWIGRSEGLEIQFAVENHPLPLTIFTTRPDTLFGVSFIAIAPQHPLAKAQAEKNEDIKAFLDECKNIKVAEAELATLEKRGVKTDLFAIHPITEEKIPIWIANFVLMEYGAGALMAVPAHDERDFEFAKKYNLPIQQVIAPKDLSEWDFSKNAFLNYGTLINSGEFNNLSSEDAFSAIATFLEQHNKAKRNIHYRLRDWSISRQRYWGTPIPIIYCEACGPQPVPDQDLPVILPTEVEFTGVASPLKNMTSFYEVTCPNCKSKATRETDTFDTFMESSWYYARYACPDQETKMLDERANYWTPVDQYIGGIEHAVMHLLYARFIHKTIRDLGLLNSDEPFKKLLTQGMVLNKGTKMSKSKGNVVDPLELIEQFGADTVRLFIIFAAPPEQNLEWSDSGVEGAHRFLKRLWAFVHEHKENIVQHNLHSVEFDINALTHTQGKALQELNTIMSQIQFDYDRMQFNTVVSGAMKLFNLLTKTATEESSEDFNRFFIHKGVSLLLRYLAPITPFITESLWKACQFKDEIIVAEWPKEDKINFKLDTVELVVQINGKLRTKISVPSNANETTIKDIAVSDLKVKNSIENKVIKKIITVPGRLINIVVGESE